MDDGDLHRTYTARPVEPPSVEWRLKERDQIEEMVRLSALSHMKYMLFGGAGVMVLALLIGVPLQSALLYGILLACPLMMIFMMRGHGHDHGQTDRKDSETHETQQPAEHITHTHRM